MSTELAPVILFIYNRPNHTRKTLEALQKNVYAADSVLYVFADGPKDNAGEDDLQKIKQARSVVKEEPWCKEVILIAREKNMNLEDNVIDGITQVINQHGKAIILEDDLITSPYFLQYCNNGLKMYEDVKQVFAINGFMFPVEFQKEAGTFLCPIATSAWGWATWADRWNQFEAQPQYISEIENNKFLRNRFNIGDHDFLSMLKNLNTWDIRWYYTAFIRNGLGLFPTHSLIKNIGFDGSGTHEGNNAAQQDVYLLPIKIKYQNTIAIDYYLKVLGYFKIDAAPNTIGRKIKHRIKNILHVK